MFDPAVQQKSLRYPPATLCVAMRARRPERVIFYFG